MEVSQPQLKSGISSVPASTAISRVKAAVDLSPRLLTCQYDYTSPLHFAVREGHVEMVKLLLESGADPNKSGAPWSMPLVLARKKNQVQVEVVLRKSGAE